jgi:hypothetical protein
MISNGTDNLSPAEPDNGLVDPQFGDVRILEFKPGANLVPVIRKSKEMFTDTAIAAEKKYGLTLVVNGEQYKLSTASKLWSLVGSPEDPSSTITIGEVIQDGKVVSGISSPLSFYVAEVRDDKGNLNYKFGQGDPPADAVVGFGGAIPLRIDGLNYGVTNEYSKDGQLIQKSNLGFAAYDKYPNAGTQVGKVIIAYDSKDSKLAVVVQPDGAPDGKKLWEIRDYLRDNNYENAIAFDGSSSTTLVMNNKVEIMPADYKNVAIDVGIGVKYTPIPKQKPSASKPSGH